MKLTDKLEEAVNHICKKAPIPVWFVWHVHKKDEGNMQLDMCMQWMAIQTLLLQSGQGDFILFKKERFESLEWDSV